MKKIRVFISSVQSEFAEERQMLFDYLTTDALLGKFFDPFIFENLPAMNNYASSVYLNEVKQCDLYIGLFGKQYGYEDVDGISPTEREFDYAGIHSFGKKPDWKMRLNLFKKKFSKLLFGEKK